MNTRCLCLTIIVAETVVTKYLNDVSFSYDECGKAHTQTSLLYRYSFFNLHPPYNFKYNFYIYITSNITLYNYMTSQLKCEITLLLKMIHHNSWPLIRKKYFAVSKATITNAENAYSKCKCVAFTFHSLTFVWHFVHFYLSIVRSFDF